jgi:excisionase family DNA binding protein
MSRGDSMNRPTESTAHRGPTAVIDGRSCSLLNEMVLDKIRTKVRGRDPQLDAALLAILRAGLEYRESSATGTGVAAQPEPGPRLQGQLNETFSTSTAATILNITDRAVRKAITEKRLMATLLDGRYRITREDLSAFMAGPIGHHD